MSSVFRFSPACFVIDGVYVIYSSLHFNCEYTICDENALPASKKCLLPALELRFGPKVASGYPAPRLTLEMGHS